MMQTAQLLPKSNRQQMKVEVIHAASRLLQGEGTSNGYFLISIAREIEEYLNEYHAVPHADSCLTGDDLPAPIPMG